MRAGAAVAECRTCCIHLYKYRYTKVHISDVECCYMNVCISLHCRTKAPKNKTGDEVHLNVMNNSGNDEQHVARLK